MSVPIDIVFLVDCDNTLLDNDRVESDLRDHLAQEFGADSRDRYWAIFEALRSELGYADYLGALQRYRLGDMNDPRLLLMSSYLVDYPFADRLYAGSLAAIAHLRRLGPDGHPLGRRRRLPAAQDPAVRAVGSGRRPAC